MLRYATFVLGLSSTLLAFVAVADDAVQPVKELETLMCERGKLLLSDDFDKGPGQVWRVAKGKWVVVNGATQSSEVESDNHGAVIRANLPLRNLVIQYAFMLEGAKTTTFSINDAKGHNSRVLVNATGFSARKDDHDHAGPDKAALLQTVKTPIREGQWHTLVIEINGPELLARLDGEKVVYGSHTAIDVDKTNIGLTVGGQSVSFKNLRVWEGTPKADWPATKKKLLAESE
jgi:hypothetical protein